MKALRFFVLVVLMLLTASVTLAQGSSKAVCGDIIESEFTEDNQPQSYVVTMAPGDALEVSAIPLGDTLKLIIVVTAPNDALVGLGGDNVTGYPQAAPGKNPSVQTGILSARGTYTIIAYNAAYIRGFTGNSEGGIGVYTLYIGCTLRDGTVIAPGDATVDAPPENSDGGGTTPPPAFSGIGFPGLPPVDFAGVALAPFIPAVPLTSVIPVDGSGVLGFSLDANAGDVLKLDLALLSGNLNIGVAVLSDKNEVIYFSALSGLKSQTTLFTLPAAGKYTIGMMRLALLPPVAPEPTVVQITGTLNP